MCRTVSDISQRPKRALTDALLVQGDVCVEELE